MIDTFLRATDKAAMDAALASVRDADGNPLPGVCIDVIGIVSTVTGYDGNGAPIVVTQPGYHANVRFTGTPTKAQTDGLAGVAITAPASPFRTWET